VQADDVSAIRPHVNESHACLLADFLNCSRYCVCFEGVQGNLAKRVRADRANKANLAAESGGSNGLICALSANG
jgi:hypothetical protein